MTNIKEEVLLNKLKIDEEVSYKDSPYLQKIISLIKDVHDEDKETLLFLYDINFFLGNCYTRLGRFSLSAIYRFECIKIAKKLKVMYAHDINNIKDVIYNFLRDRNFYIDDDCLDAKEEMYGLLPDEEIEKMYKNRLTHRRNLKADPVEMSEKYLSVIDKIEEKIEKNRTIYGMGSCFEVWNLKEEFLAEEGISWKSPALLNPRVMFD